MLINGLSTRPGLDKLDVPSASRIAHISPLAQLRQGNYNTPTYIIHGTDDEVAPFAAAERFVDELSKKNIRHGFLPLAGVNHIHDVRLVPGTGSWEDQVAPGYHFLFEVIRYG